MKNGTQFSDLKNYLNADFCDSHSVIEYETKSGVRYFIVETVIKTDIYDEIYNQIKNDDEEGPILRFPSIPMSFASSLPIRHVPSFSM